MYTTRCSLSLTPGSTKSGFFAVKFLHPNQLQLRINKTKMKEDSCHQYANIHVISTGRDAQYWIYDATKWNVKSSAL